MRLRLLLALIIGCWTAATASPDSISVGIVTCDPGAEIYQLEGHAALHISGTLADEPIDVAVNYGVFDFNAPNFVYRFVKGETDYMMAIEPWERFLMTYARHGRAVTEYTVPMDSSQTAKLIALLNENYLPQNRVYRYNYVKDNCATRPLRIVELALGDTIMFGEPQHCATDSTFRQVMRAHHRNYPWYQFGIDLALGSGIDKKITTREKTFAPTLLGEQLDSATIDGHLLVSQKTPVLLGVGNPVLGPTPWYLSPLAVCWALFVIVTVISWRDIVRKTVSRWLDTILYTIYGAAGLVLTFLIFVSVHEATSPNWLYLWLNPLCLIVPVFIWLKKRNIVVMSYQIINFALILVMCVAWPFVGQSGNAAFIPLIGCDLWRAVTYIAYYRTPQHSDRYGNYSRTSRTR